MKSQRKLIYVNYMPSARVSGKVIARLDDRQSGAGRAVLYSGGQHRAEYFVQQQCILRRAGYRGKDHEQVPAHGIGKSLSLIHILTQPVSIERCNGDGWKRRNSVKRA